MKVKELMELLATQPQDAMVLRGDNSGGYETIYEVKAEEVSSPFDVTRKLAEAKAVILN
jgi:hypothetical protein